MHRARFDGLCVIRRKWESKTGCAEICRKQDGTKHIRLQLHAPACQSEILTVLDAATPSRLEEAGAEILLPYRDGISLAQWRFTQKPSFRQRRDACLSLLGQIISDKLPCCLLTLCVMPENVVFSGDDVFLQYLPDLSRWKRGFTMPQAVCAVAELFHQILRCGVSRWQEAHMPQEWRLFCLRTAQRHYIDWGQLQQDLSALPSELAALREAGHILLKKAAPLVRRYGRPVAHVVLALLLGVSLLSLVSAYRIWRIEAQAAWSGVAVIGDQALGQEQEVP